jgi:hypothetical protein
VHVQDVSNFPNLPDAPYERAMLLQNMLIGPATGGGPEVNDGLYRQLRAELTGNPAAKQLVPQFVRTSRDLSAFWDYIKYAFSTYAERRDYIRKAFGPLLDHLEGRHRTPVDALAADVLASFDPEGVHRLWEKALARRQTDPEAAITAARTLLESVCKQLLDEEGIAYAEGEDLPALYGKVARVRNLAPSQHTEETFKAILGSCQQVVERLGSLRNKLGDAHGQGRRPVRPATRHAALAVNLAGAMAMFIVETWQARRTEEARPD